MPAPDTATKALIARVSSLIAAAAEPGSGALTESTLDRVHEEARCTAEEFQTVLDYLGAAGLVRVSAFGSLHLTTPAEEAP